MSSWPFLIFPRHLHKPSGKSWYLLNGACTSSPRQGLLSPSWSQILAVSENDLESLVSLLRLQMCTTAWFILCWGLNSGPSVCKSSTLATKPLKNGAQVHTTKFLVRIKWGHFVHGAFCVQITEHRAAAVLPAKSPWLLRGPPASLTCRGPPSRKPSLTRSPPHKHLLHRVSKPCVPKDGEGGGEGYCCPSTCWDVECGWSESCRQHQPWETV